MDNLYFQQNINYELRDTLEVSEIFFPKIYAGEIAIKKIIKERKSLARFGDGEFSVIAGRIRHKFQTQEDEELKKRLIEVLHSKNENLLIGIADNYGSLEKYTPQAKREIRCYLNPQVRKEHLQLLEKDRIYYDAYVTRPYVMYEDNATEAPKKRFLNLRRIWDKRECIFVEGEKTAMGVGNDLFDNVKSIKRIIAPAENAFEKYEVILDACMKQSKENLFLLALGPAATVLAYDLCKAGYQAIDIGHLDLEYEWFLRGKGYRTPVEGKYNNEVENGENVEITKNVFYQNQIITFCK